MPMERLEPQQIRGFFQRYRLKGGLLKAVRVRRVGQGMSVRLSLRARTNPTQLGGRTHPVRLQLELRGVEEYRYQARPGRPVGRVGDARIGYLHGLFYLMLDAYALEPGEQPALHDFRASECYAGGTELWWCEAPTPGPSRPDGNPRS